MMRATGGILLILQNVGNGFIRDPTLSKEVSGNSNGNRETKVPEGSLTMIGMYTSHFGDTNFGRGRRKPGITKVGRIQWIKVINELNLCLTQARYQLVLKLYMNQNTYHRPSRKANVENTAGVNSKETQLLTKLSG
jgi:hypothetical protein